MSLFCTFGRHRPSLASVARKPGHLVGICEECGQPLIKNEAGKWAAAPPLVDPAGQRAA
ncbi:MAG TPA: hypothetical protein VF680_13445 [Allosphingosinicella sp.]|jgi:hypothetical protein